MGLAAMGTAKANSGSIPESLLPVLTTVSFRPQRQQRPHHRVAPNRTMLFRRLGGWESEAKLHLELFISETRVPLSLFSF